MSATNVTDVQNKGLPAWAIVVIVISVIIVAVVVTIIIVTVTRRNARRRAIKEAKDANLRQMR